MKAYIQMIEQFETEEGKKYWINVLRVSDTVKGRLIIHFNLYI